MADITLQQIEEGLENALLTVQKLAPLAALGGPAAAAIGNAVGAIAGAGAQIVEQAGSDEAIIASGDVTKITALQAQLQSENAALTAQALQA